MNYAKVFSEDKYITNKPAHEGRKILKQHFEEVFENKCYASVQKKKEQEENILKTRSLERLKQERKT